MAEADHGRADTDRPTLVLRTRKLSGQNLFKFYETDRYTYETHSVKFWTESDE